MQVSSIMRSPRTVEPGEYATKVRAILREGDRIILVVENGRLLGVITRKDVMLITTTKSNLRARDIMGDPLVTAEPGEEIHTTGKKMMEYDVYSMPVLNASQVVGVVHMEDILQAVYRPSPRKVRDIMKADVVFCDRTEKVPKVWDLMETHNFTGLPVTEEVSTSHRRYRKLVGFVTRKDILRSGDVRLGGDSQKLTHPPPIEKVMTRTPRLVRPDDPVDNCVKMFKQYSIGRLPVVRNGFELVGIVDREDILRLYV